MLQPTQKLSVSAIALALVLTFSTAGFSQPRSQTNDIKGFFSNLVGEWVGTCEQTTDGQKADNKYFHAVVKQTGPSTFTSQFDYYRLDPNTGAPLKIGVSNMTTTIGGDGAVKNSIAGSGQVMVDEHTSKPQTHELCEVLKMSSGGSVQGSGGGTIKVSGMPFNVGKSGRVKDDKSSWSLCNGVLKISQRLKVGFKALFVSKSFNIAADFTAKRGKDVVALMMRNQGYASRYGGASR